MTLMSGVLLKAGLIILTILLVCFILIYLLVKKMHNMAFNHRYDKTMFHFFTHRDFKGLNIEPFEFESNNQNILRGNIYYYERENYIGVAVVSHGLGCGHLQYTYEIEHLASLGFKVVAYDNTGCATSDGEAIHGLPQGIIDLKNCLSYIRKRDDLKRYKKCLFGHSWGGYSVINTLPFLKEKDNVECAVTMGAPFSSTDVFVETLSSYSKVFKFTRGFIAKIEKELFGDISKMNTLASLSNVDVDVLLIHGTKDHVVNYESNFKFVMENLEKDNVHYLTVDNKRHRPNISDDATAYDETVSKSIEELNKNKASKEELKAYYDNINYLKLVEFDENVMNSIDEFILKHF